jgi:hypothetical protein
MILLAGSVMAAACAPEEPPVRSVTEFVENPILLEAAMVRCSRERAESRYEQECINAREAVKRVQAKEEEAGRHELEARSERKRAALRRTRQAQAEALRRAEESERLREEAEYLAQFGVLPPTGESGDEESDLPEGNVPLAVVPETAPQETPSGLSGDTLPAVDGGNAPVIEVAPAEDEQPDLETVREELQRRGSGDTS